MKKFVLAVLLIVAVLYAGSVFIEIEGLWFDRLASRVLSRQFGRPVRITGVVLERLKHVRFKSLEISSSAVPGQPLLESGPGHVDANFLVFNSDYWQFEASGIRLLNGARQRLKALPEALSADLLKEDAIRLLRGHVAVDAGGVSIGISEMLFKGGRLKGQLYLGGGQVRRAQGILWIDKDLSARLLKHVYLKMVMESDGPLRLRLSIRKNLLTLHGPAGPILQFKWGG